MFSDPSPPACLGQGLRGLQRHPSSEEAPADVRTRREFGFAEMSVLMLRAEDVVRAAKARCAPQIEVESRLFKTTGHFDQSGTTSKESPRFADSSRSRRSDLERSIVLLAPYIGVRGCGLHLPAWPAKQVGVHDPAVPPPTFVAGFFDHARSLNELSGQKDLFVHS
jgi:hypothetical protein